MKLREKGFTLVELLIVMAILAFIVVGVLMTLNPIAQTNKGLDARRKSDLNRIKISFEDYFSDKGCYPTGDLLVSLNNESNCQTSVFSPWLTNWPCDPNGGTYNIIVEEDDCPGWFKILTNLNNRSDGDIPEGWYTLGEYYYVGDGTISTNDVNYGVSSTNVNWFEREISERCYQDFDGSCYERSTGPGVSCQLDFPGDYCGDPTNCYVNRECLSFCQVSCCNNGLPCE